LGVTDKFSGGEPTGVPLKWLGEKSEKVLLMFSRGMDRSGGNSRGQAKVVIGSVMILFVSEEEGRWGGVMLGGQRGVSGWFAARNICCPENEHSK